MYSCYRFSFAKRSGHVGEALCCPFYDASLKVSLPHTFISTSTPLGSSSFMSASIVLDDELYISSSRLYELNWNCSLDFLFTCGDLKTVNIFLWVGNGIGPVTTAPVDLTVFTIFSADLSTRL